MADEQKVHNKFIKESTGQAYIKNDETGRVSKKRIDQVIKNDGSGNTTGAGEWPY